MLHYFPEARPEELFLSILARYGEHLRLWRRGQVQQQVFGRGNIAIGVELPRALEILIGRLPVNCNLSVKGLINNHTLLPLYVPFIDSSSRDLAKQAMSRDETRDVKGLVGRNGKILNPEWLRFCPLCWKQDQEIYGEPFWYRSHQVAGVEICLKHRVFLEASNAPRDLHGSRYTLYTAKASCPSAEARNINESEQGHSALVDIASDVEWLLSKNSFLPDPVLLRRRYLELLQEAGFAVASKKIHYTPLQEAIKTRFSSVTLRAFDCVAPRSDRWHWIARLLQEERNSLMHPMHHLILIRTLGYSAESFFELLRERPTRFGKGPWPCNNPICTEYQIRVIQDYDVSYKYVKPRGLFQCKKCGYSYFGTGLSESSDNSFTIGRCCNRGDLWRNRLAELWSDTSNSLPEIGRMLCASINEIIKQASLQGLSIRACDNNDKNHALLDKAKTRLQARIELSQSKRLLWLHLQRKYPDASIKQLGLLPGSPIEWLRKNDRLWLLENRPSPKRRGRTKGESYTLEDWASRDQEYSQQIEQAASDIKSLPGRPIRASASAICRLISTRKTHVSVSSQASVMPSSPVSQTRPLSLAHLQKSYMLKNLPVTQRTLFRIVESPLDFARRRLTWAADQCRRSTSHFTVYKLTETAGVRTLVEKNPQRSESIILCALAEKLCGGTA